MIETRGLTVQYPSRSEPTLAGVDLHVVAGELVLLSGPTGCGKSTLLNCLNGVLLHESDASIEGDIALNGRDLLEIPLPEVCRLAGSVFQNPDSQLCTATVETEIAFGLENQAIAREKMHNRIAEALDMVGLTGRADAATATLSGGQKQRLAIACALALRPRILLLDEPVSQLDPDGTAEILDVIARLKDRHDLAVVLVEHRIEDVARLADRIVLMDGGRIVSDLPRDEALADLGALRRLGLTVPHLPDLFEKLGRDERPLSSGAAPILALREDSETLCVGPPPSAVAVATGDRRGRRSYTGQMRKMHRGRGKVLDGGGAESSLPADAAPICFIRSLRFQYEKAAPVVLEGIDLDLQKGDRIALMGSNGSGKSTLLHLLAGIAKPTAGSIEWHLAEGNDVPVGSRGLVVQQPDLMLFQETVLDEAAFGPRHLGLRVHAVGEAARGAIERMGLAAFASEPPFALSRGQRLRAAVASVLSMSPRVLLLDEPTTGQDREQIERMMDGLAEGFDLVVFCTHDVDTAARHANRVVVLHGGRILLDGSPREALRDRDTLRAASIRPTSAQEYARRLGLDCLGVEELVRALRPE